MHCIKCHNPTCIMQNKIPNLDASYMPNWNLSMTRLTMIRLFIVLYHRLLLIVQNILNTEFGETSFFTTRHGLTYLKVSKSIKDNSKCSSNILRVVPCRFHSMPHSRMRNSNFPRCPTPPRHNFIS